jgi:hypothetical protein
MFEPVPAPNTLPAKVTNIVLGSTSDALPSAWLPMTMMKATGIIV